MTETDKITRVKEQEKNSERYRMVMVGGRVKSAGASFAHLYNAASPVLEAPDSIDSAFQTAKGFARLKEKPPIEIRMAFFPQDEGAMRAAFKGLGIYRPTIKTDQGPAGNVGYFHIGIENSSQINGQISQEEGVGIVESFLQKRFSQANLSEFQQEEIRSLVERTQREYALGNYRKAYEAIFSMRELCASMGIETTRKAGVGRGEFFFFRPVKMREGIIIGKNITDAISEKTQEVVGRIERLAGLTRQYVLDGLSIEEAMNKAYEASRDISINGYQKGLLYFQPDVLIRKDGTFDIERINMPDLGMFLTEVNTPSPNFVLEDIKTINREIRDEILDVVSNSSVKDVVLVTRQEVLDNCEDTLEQLEIAAFGEGLRIRGKNVKVESLKSVRDLPLDSSIILFNVDAQSSDFENLLCRVAAGEIQCFLDPFIRLFEKDATTFQSKKIEGQVLDKFLKIIAPSALDKPEGVYSKQAAIHNALRLGGINEDIIYFSVNGDRSFIPVFRYDIKSFSEVYKAVENARRRGEDVSEITAVPVPFKPEDAVIEGHDGPRLAVFRFAFVKK